MSSIDERIVQMKMDNSDFDGNATKSMGILDKLKAALNFKNQGGGLDELQKSASGFSLGGLTSGVASGVKSFGALQVAGVAALATIVSKAVDAGLRIGKALTIDNIKAGFESYNEQINSTQIILANTAAAGVKLKDVEGVLAELQKYAQQTVYSFSDMTSAIGRFTAAGVPLKDATFAVKGLANAAALSGTNTQQLSSAYYQVSQALSAGTFKLQDWNSLVNANLGGKNIQNVIEATARTMGDEGKAMDAAIKKHGDFRQSLQEGWLTADIFNKSMKVFAGTVDSGTGKMRAFSVEEIKGMGYTEKQAESLHKLSAAALDSATKIRTLPQLFSALKEEVAGSIANVFKTLLGNLPNATKLFTSLHNTLEYMFTQPINDFNKFLQGFAKLGGVKNVIKSIANVFNFLINIIKTGHKAFDQIFPPTTIKQAVAFSKAVLDFTKSLKMSKSTAHEVFVVFEAFFSVLDIGWQFVKALVVELGFLFGLFGKNSGGIKTAALEFANFLINLDKTVKSTHIFSQIFGALNGIISKPVGAIKLLGSLLAAFFSHLDSHPVQALSDKISELTGATGAGSKIAGTFSDIWNTIKNVLSNVGNMIKPAWDSLKKLASSFIDALSQSFQNNNFTPLYAVLNNIFAVSVLGTIKKIFDKKTLNIDFGGGVVKSIKETFETLTGSLKAMQNQVNAKTLLLIAAAIGLLTLSIIAISMIKTEKLISAMSGIATGFGILLGAMAIMTKITGLGGTAKMTLLAGSLIALAAGMLILAAAVKILSSMSWEELAKGILGVAALLGILAAATKLMPKGQLLTTAAAIIPLAAGLLLLSFAVKAFAGMSWEELGKGMGAIAAGLLIIAGATQLMPKDIGVKALALVVLAAALLIMSQAIQSMGGMSWESIAKSMVVLAGGLAILAGGLFLMTEALPGAAALIVAAAALAILAPALQSFGNMSWESIGKSMVVLFGALVLLAAGMALMDVSVSGAASLILISFALSNIAGVFQILGKLSWSQVLISLVALAGALTIIGVAAVILTPIVPVIEALGAAVFLLGAAVGLAGLGVLAFATGLALLAAVGAGAAAAILAIGGVLPVFAAQLAAALGAFIVGIYAQQQQIVTAFIGIAGALITGLSSILPQISVLIGQIMDVFVNVIGAKGPAVISTFYNLLQSLLGTISAHAQAFGAIGAQIIANFLNGITSRINAVVGAATNLIVTFINAISAANARIVNAGVKAIIAFVNGVANAIRSHTGEMNAAGRNIGSAIVQGLTAGIGGAASGAISAAINVARRAISAAKSALGIHSPSREFMEIGSYSSQGLAIGIESAGNQVTKSATNISVAALDSVRKTMSGLSDTLSADSNLNPTITPVLDLSNVTKNAPKVGDLLNTTVTPTVSYAQAADISNTKSATDAAIASQPQGKGDVNIKLEQTNNSPEALDALTIYRQTNSQLSMLKEAITKL